VDYLGTLQKGLPWNLTKRSSNMLTKTNSLGLPKIRIKLYSHNNIYFLEKREPYKKVFPGTLRKGLPKIIRNKWSK
jgi:hypothetical protein